jgi:hypothetical protein
MKIRNLLFLSFFPTITVFASENNGIDPETYVSKLHENKMTVAMDVEKALQKKRVEIFNYFKRKEVMTDQDIENFNNYSQSIKEFNQKSKLDTFYADPALAQHTNFFQRVMQIAGIKHYMSILPSSEEKDFAYASDLTIWDLKKDEPVKILDKQMQMTNQDFEFRGTLQLSPTFIPGTAVHEFSHQLLFHPLEKAYLRTILPYQYLQLYNQKIIENEADLHLISKNRDWARSHKQYMKHINTTYPYIDSVHNPYDSHQSRYIKLKDLCKKLKAEEKLFGPTAGKKFDDVN